MAQLQVNSHHEMGGPPPYQGPSESSQIVAVNTSQAPAATTARMWGPNDVFIALMGVTGAGKSSFISQLIGSADIEIGHGLQSTTKVVSVHESHILDGRRLFLIDTPGFDDTFTSDVEILRQIAFAFSSLYKGGACMWGMIYLHRITDPRMGGSALTNLEIFKKLCGPQAMPIVRLVSTRWESLQEGDPLFETAQQHEKQLCTSEKFWAPMLRDGALALRHFGNVETALNILKTIINTKIFSPLTIQTELVQDKLELGDTQAGRLVAEKQRELETQHKQEIDDLKAEIDEALKAKDEQLSQILAKELQRQQQEYEVARPGTTVGQHQLKTTFEQLNKGMLGTLTREPAASGSSSRDGNEELDMKQMKARMDLLAQNIADLQEEIERNDQVHANQIKRLKRQAQESGKHSEAEVARQAAQMAALHEEERARRRRRIEDYQTQQRRLRKSRTARDDPLTALIKFFTT